MGEFWPLLTKARCSDKARVRKVTVVDGDQFTSASRICGVRSNVLCIRHAQSRIESESCSYESFSLLYHLPNANEYY
jgi:hypothetical protein